MSRRILARRFEPRYGVNESMLEVEARYVARELEDYLLMSSSDLKTKLTERQAVIHASEQDLESRFRSLPDRERIALRCMLARDFFHIAKLYCRVIDAASIAQATDPCEPVVEELDQNQEQLPTFPFKQSLFD